MRVESPLLAVLCGTFLTIAPASQEMLKLGATGTARVPGTGGKMVDYKVAASKPPGTDNKLNFWLDLTNNNTVAVSLVVCAMVNLKNHGTLKVPHFRMSKQNNIWSCVRATDVTQSVNYHFGCVRLTIPPGESRYAFDTVGAPVCLDRAFKECDIASVYFDLLEDCPVDPSCEDVVGPNAFLVPHSSSYDTVNIWGSARGRIELTGCLACMELGNWVTMGFPNRYPSRLVGRITNAIPNSTFILTIPGVPLRQYRAPANGVIPINVPFVITPAIAQFMTLSYRPPSAQIPENTVTEFHASVLGEPNNPVYRTGQFMYGIDQQFVRDTRPPTILSVNVRNAGSGALGIDVEATDSFTMPTSASVRQTIGTTTTTVGLGFGDPPMSGSSTFFTGCLGPFANNTRVTYQIMVADLQGNVATTAAGTIVVKGNRGTSFTSPNGFASTEGDSNHGYILASQRDLIWQQIDSTLKGTSYWGLKSIAWRRDGLLPTNAAYVRRTLEMEITLAHSNLRKITRDFRRNYLGNPTTVFARKNVSMPDWTRKPATVPAAFAPRLGFNTPWTYSGKDDLLWQVNVGKNPGSPYTPFVNYPFDFQSTPGTFVSSTIGTTLGQGCISTGQTSRFTLVTRLLNDLRTFTLEHSATGAPRSTPVLSMVDVRDPNLSVPGFCANLRATPLLIVPIGTASTTGTVPRGIIDIPYDPRLVNGTFFLQAFALDAGQRGIPVSLSNGKRLVFPVDPRLPAVGRVYSYVTGGGRVYSGPWTGGIIARFN